MPRRLSRLLPLIALMPGLAHAADRTETLPGTGLDLSGTCARSVQITPDPALSDTVAVQASAAHPEEIAQLAFERGSPVRIGRRAPETPC